MIKGSRHTDEARRKLSEASRRTHALPHVRARLSECARLRMSQVDQRGSKNPTWRGDHASYKAFHTRVKVLRGSPQACEVCGTEEPSKRYEWANLTGRYQDPWDYKRMCSSCHRKADHLVCNLPAVYTVSQGPAKSRKWNSWDELIADALLQIEKAEARITALKSRITNLEKLKKQERAV